MTGRHIAADRRQAGFSLVELMVVIGVAAILMAILVLGIRQATASFALRKAAGVAMSEVRRAQAGAIAEGVDYAVEFVTGTPGSLIISKEAGSEPCPAGMVDEGTSCTRRITGSDNWPRAVAILSTTFAGDRVTFGRLGAPSDGGQVVLRSGTGTQWQLVIEAATGKVSVQR